MNQLSLWRRYRRGVVTFATTALILAAPACHSTECQTCGHGGIGHGKFKDPFADVPQEAQPQPNGSYVREAIYRQASKAEMDDFYLYERHFQRDSAELAPDGLRTVKMAATRLPLVPYAMTIEDTGSDEMNTARRGVVIAKLLELGFVDAPKRVTVGDHQAEGLFGDEAQFAYQRLLLGALGGFGGGIGGGGIGGIGGVGGIGGGLGGFGGGLGGGLGGLGGFGGGGIGGFGGLGF